MAKQGNKLPGNVVNIWVYDKLTTAICDLRIKLGVVQFHFGTDVLNKKKAKPVTRKVFENTTEK